MKKHLFIIPLIAVGLMLSHGTATAQVKPYTKNTCIVTDNELGSMGKVITKTHKDQQVKFCCKPCVKKFDKNPDKYIKELKG